jgi:predicted HTH domain antitoxin
MIMQSVNLAIPNDVMYEVRELSGQDAGTTNKKIQTYLAIGLFVSRTVSLAKASELAGQTLPEFMGTLKFLGIPAVTYTEEMLDDDIAFADRVL